MTFGNEICENGLKFTKYYLTHERICSCIYTYVCVCYMHTHVCVHSPYILRKLYNYCIYTCNSYIIHKIEKCTFDKTCTCILFLSQFPQSDNTVCKSPDLQIFLHATKNKSFKWFATDCLIIYYLYELNTYSVHSSIQIKII